jgi:hypothetical protein
MTELSSIARMDPGAGFASPTPSREQRADKLLRDALVTLDRVANDKPSILSAAVNAHDIRAYLESADA